MSDRITSLDNPRIKHAAQLRGARVRRHERQMLIDGRHELLQAWNCGCAVREVFFCPELVDAETLAELERRCSRFGASWTEITRAVLTRLAYGDRADGVVAVAAWPHCGLDRIPAGENSLLAVLEKVEKPGNWGAVARSAVGAGIHGVILADAPGDLFNPNAIRASQGAMFHLPWAAATAAQAQDWLVEHAFRILAARVDGTVRYDRADYSGRVALVLGSESRGLSEAWRGSHVESITLPMLGPIDSLNISATAAVLFYEALRQRSR